MPEPLPPYSSMPQVAYPPIIEHRAAWSDPWTQDDRLELESMQTEIAGRGVGSCAIRFAYGSKAKSPGDAALALRGATSLMGHWLRVRLANDQGAYSVQWIGKVGSESRDFRRSGDAPAGWQRFTAYEPAYLLRRISVSQSYWLRGGLAVLLDWIPDMNVRDDRGFLLGNRTVTRYSGTYIFGQGELWTRYDALEYFLGRFVNEGGTSGPKWTIGGQADLLRDIADALRFSRTQTMADVLAQIINPQLGLDYAIIPDPVDQAAFQVYVYPLVSEPVTFLGVGLPANALTVSIQTRDHPALVQTDVQRNDELRYGRIRVLGGRIVSCCTLVGAVDPVAQSSRPPTLIPKWSTALEAEYKAGTGNPSDEAADHDGARTADRFRSVYRLFGAPPDWDFNGHNAAPVTDAEGNVVGTASLNYQTDVRGTLSWLPLKEGVDYGNGGEVDLNPLGFLSDQLPASAWIWDEDHARYVPCESLGIDVYVTYNDWGVFLQAHPNHVLAKNHFAGAEATSTEPKYDYDTLIATIALHTDLRLILEFPLTPGGAPSDGVHEVVAEEAELWWLAPDTVVGVELDGTPRTSGGVGRVLRNDAQRIALIAAGIKARFYQQRARASLVFNGLLPYGYLTGQILTVIEQDGEATSIEAPITSVEWDVRDRQPQTIIRTGYA